MCKAGQAQAAYELAKSDLALDPTNVWVQREVGWALYHLLRKDSEGGSYDSLLAHFDELLSLDRLTLSDDRMMFDNVLFWVGFYAKMHLQPSSYETPERLSALYSRLKSYRFSPSKGYSILIEGFSRCIGWEEILDFIDWWGLDNFMEEDYQPVETSTGRRIISVAERVYISVSKALLQKNDKDKIEAFLPRLERLEKEHPRMTYPGYFHGKLLLALGSTQEESLKVVIPFAKRKVTEFWVWQLLSDVFSDDHEKQLACLLRAVNSRTQGKFLGKVRIKLAEIYIKRGELDLAKFQIDNVTRTYLSEGWPLPAEVEYWVHQPWIKTVSGRDESPIDYMRITDGILYGDYMEGIAIVTHFDSKSGKTFFVYGHKQRSSQKLNIRVETGDVLKINYTAEGDGRIRVLSASKTQLPSGLDFAKVVSGTVKRWDGNSHAHLHFADGKAFISPKIVEKHHLEDGQRLECTILYDYNRSRNEWSWVVIKINQ